MNVSNNEVRVHGFVLYQVLKSDSWNVCKWYLTSTTRNGFFKYHGDIC